MYFKQECHQDRLPDKSILVILPEKYMDEPGELVEAYRLNRILVDFLPYGKEVPNHRELNKTIGDHQAALFFFPARRAPGTIIENLFLTNHRGQAVPIGLVPVKGKGTIRNFCRTASKLQKRPQVERSLAVLAQRHPRYLKVASRIEKYLHQHSSWHCFNWSSDVVIKEDMFTGLGSGMGLAIYLGHGRPKGWSGYYGTRIDHFSKSRKPMGAMVSLCCHTASRRRVSISFAENLVLKGISGASLGAINATLHQDNTRWAVRMMEVKPTVGLTIGELLRQSAPPNKNALTSYRLIGDPMSPVLTNPEALEIAKNVKIYA
jgi:hypothetical protein